jgi:predicted CXXCH cytochrome family protein
MEKQGKLAEMEKKEKLDSKVKEVRGAFTHNPVKEGNCGACHAYHSSDNGLLMKQASTIELCGTCHDWQKHSSHPLGPKVRDSRNKNMTMDCLTCHRSHGTGYRWILTFKTTTDLCVQCHKQIKK